MAQQNGGGDAPERSSCARRLKLQLFQELARDPQPRSAWPQYWRALQLFVAAELSRGEFERAMERVLATPELVELHNALVAAILVQADAADDAQAVKREDS